VCGAALGRQNHKVGQEDGKDYERSVGAKLISEGPRVDESNYKGREIPW